MQLPFQGARAVASAVGHSIIRRQAVNRATIHVISVYAMRQKIAKKIRAPIMMSGESRMRQAGQVKPATLFIVTQMALAWTADITTEDGNVTADLQNPGVLVYPMTVLQDMQHLHQIVQTVATLRAF